MKPQFFGQYLIEKKVIDKKVLLEALGIQKNKSPRLGEIAIKFGFLTEQQTAQIWAEQKRVDKMFGELAVSMGFITKLQLDEIVTIQMNNHVYLGQVLVEMGIFDNKTLNRFLEDFHKQQRPSTELNKLLPPEVATVKEIVTALDVTMKMFRRVADMKVKIGEGTLIDYVDVKDLLVTIKLQGITSFRIIINCSKEVKMEIGRKMYGETEVLDDEDLKDCIGELGNTICGFLLARFIEFGHDLKIHPPETFFKSAIQKYSLNTGFKWAVLFPATLPGGSLDIGIAGF